MFRARVAPAVLVVILVALFAARPSAGRQASALPAYTLVQRVTFYDAAGNATPVRELTRYASARGDWRAVWTYAGGLSEDTMFLPGKGVYYTDRKGKRLARLGDEATGRPATVTADELTVDPKFVRVEYVTGILTYVKREKINGYTYEWYYAPELGNFPLKTVVSEGACREVSEPASLTFGEPERAKLKGEKYPLDERLAVFDSALDARVTEQPAPQYAPARGEARRKISVQVYVDEEGRVTRAAVVSWHPPSEAAAVEAALRARFAPKSESGAQGRLTTGVLTYELVPPAAATNEKAVGSPRD